MSITEKIIKKIKDKEIEKRPRWFFIAKNSLFWVLCGISLIVGAMAFSIILSMLSENDWDIYEKTQKTFLEHLLISIPYLWVIIIGFSLWLAYREFLQTKTGYRKMPYIIVGGIMLGSILLGTLVFAFGRGDMLAEIASKNVPTYESLVHTKNDVWRNPDNGLIAGTIKTIDETNNTLALEDLESHLWNVDVAEVFDRGLPFPLYTGAQIKIIGEKISSDLFRAQEIRPWKRMLPMPLFRKNHPQAPLPMQMKDFRTMHRIR